METKQAMQCYLNGEMPAGDLKERIKDNFAGRLPDRNWILDWAGKWFNQAEYKLISEATKDWYRMKL